MHLRATFDVAIMFTMYDTHMARARLYLFRNVGNMNLALEGPFTYLYAIQSYRYRLFSSQLLNCYHYLALNLYATRINCRLYIFFINELYVYQKISSILRFVTFKFIVIITQMEFYAT
jgi:hypothetical protein